MGLTGIFWIVAQTVCGHQRGKFVFLALTHKQISRGRSRVRRRGLFAPRKSQENESDRWTAIRMKYPSLGMLDSEQAIPDNRAWNGSPIARDAGGGFDTGPAILHPPPTPPVARARATGGVGFLEAWLMRLRTKWKS